MDRVQASQPATLSATWERAGVLVDPGTVTVTVTRDSDGTNILTSQAASGTGTAGRTVTLTPAQTAQLDYLKLTWTSSTDQSVLTTYAEVVGDFMFSVTQARLRQPLSDTTVYPTAQIMDYRTLAEMAIEDICGVAFVPRYNHHNARLASWGMLRVPRRRVRKVRSIFTMTDQGPQALPTLAGLRIENGGMIFMPALFNWWSAPITIAYESGYDFTPPRVRRAAIELMRRWIVESPWDERTTGFRTRDGGEMTILTANHTDAFDIPEVVAVADAYGDPAIF